MGENSALAQQVLTIIWSLDDCVVMVRLLKDRIENNQ